MRIIAKIEAAAAWLAALLFASTGLFLSYEVVARYFFGAPTIWAAEVSQLCLIWGSMIAMPWLLSTRRHIRVTALLGLLGRRPRRVLDILSHVLIIAFSGYLAYYGYRIFADSLGRGRTTGTLLDLPAWLYEASIPVGFALLAVAAVRATIEVVRTGVPKDPEAPE